MSIINEAIKKARKEFVAKNEPSAPVRAVREENAPRAGKNAALSSEVRWTVAVVVSLVVIISLLGSMALYRQMSRTDTDYGPAMRSAKKETSIDDFNVNSRNKAVLPGTGFKGAVELNGIVYGPEDRWAIINDNIVREGDALLNGTVSVIGKDFVKVEKEDGEEITLDLK